jgi:obscurin-RhoGEF protein
MFTEELQNTNVYINDSAILACKLSIPTDEKVEWRKNSKPVKVSKNLVVVSNNENHWLAIFRASLEDTGQYTCVCGNISTSADLTVVGMLNRIITTIHLFLSNAKKHKKDTILPWQIQWHL